MKKISFFTNKMKFITGILVMLIFLSGFWLEPFSSVNVLNIDNWQYLIGLKAIGDVVLILLLLYSFIQLLKDADISTINKIVNLVLSVGFSVLFSVDLINSLSDLNTGIKTYIGYCELDRTTTRYMTTSNYMYLMEDNPNKRINITHQEFEDLQGEYINGSSGNPYRCNREVEMYYLQYTEVSLEVK